MLNSRIVMAALAMLPFSVQAQSESCEAFSMDSGQMEISVTVSGADIPARITTSNIGASISETLASSLGARVHVDNNRSVVSSIGEDMPYRFVRNLEISLFGFDTTLDEAAVNPGADAYMTLSLLPFRELLVQINYPESQICFYPKNAVDLQEAQNTDFDTDAEYGSPVVNVQLNGDVDVWLAVTPDYAGGLFLDPAVANELGLEPGSSDDGTGDTYSTIIDSLQFGPYQMGNIATRVPRSGVQSNLRTRSNVRIGTLIPDGPGFRGRLGIDVLRHFVLTMDLDSERMHIYAP